jgi:hypothetical protein
MPYGLPAATVTKDGGHWFHVDTPGRKEWVPSAVKVEILYPGADQDGFTGHVICRVNGFDVAIKRTALRLAS